jgi:valyl-tRNA synthetase
MPFITEELWQRLPRRYNFVYLSNGSPGNQVPSIMLAPYPVHENDLHDPIAAAQYEQIIAVVKALRSLLDAYGIKEDAKSITFIKYAEYSSNPG